jgi:hypothetical protein
MRVLIFTGGVAFGALAAAGLAVWELDRRWRRAASATFVRYMAPPKV